MLDYTVRASSREAYVSPSRGQQGNALRCVIAAGFALDGARGNTVIEARGQCHRIVFEMEPVRREPRILREVLSSNVQTGTRITVHGPKRHAISSSLQKAVLYKSSLTSRPLTHI